MAKFWRHREEAVGTLLSPVLWVLLFGAGMGAIVSEGATGIKDYTQFVAPGIMSLTALTGAVVGGATLRDERRREFMETGAFYPLGALEPVQSKARIIPTSSVGRWASVARIWL
jgi:ABC-2 type transport system permease protein